MGGVDAQIRIGITAYRGQTHKWLLHDLGRYSEELKRVEAGELECDIFVGKVTSESHAERLRKLGRPVLDLLQEFNLPEWETHSLDLEAAGRMGAEAFLDMRHEHFAFLTLNDRRLDHQIWKGFSETLKGRSKQVFWIQRENHKMLEFIPNHRWMDYPTHGDRLLGLPRPLAILAHSDGTASSAMQLAFYLGIAVPEEFTFLGIGDLVPICESLHPTLSSIRLPGEKLGFEVGAHLAAHFSEKPLDTFLKIPPAEIIRRQSTRQYAVSDPIIAKALTIMRQNATEAFTINDLAEQLPLSKRSFNDRFRKFVGRTPKEELIRMRLGIARERLLTTNHTVLHVAMDAGFPDVDSMVSAFKKHMKLTPSAFRKQQKM